MSEILVLGAGMVGVATALALQGQGHAVTLLDRRGPGEETSHGNAGAIQVEAAEPYAMPRNLATLAGYALGRSNDLALRWRDLPAAAPALWAYWRASAPPRHREAALVYARLTARATQDHAPLIRDAGAGALIRHTGLLELYRDPRALEAAGRVAARLHEAYGVASELLDPEGLARAEPAFRPGLPGAVLYTGPWSATDPGALVRAYAGLFAGQGGRIVTGDAASLSQSGKGWQVRTQDGPLDAEQAVVALGPWSPDLLARFGYRVAMVWKRGYHGHYQTRARVNRPVLDAANGIVLSSMARGLRLTSGAEITDRAAPARPRQLVRGLAGLREILEIGAAVPGGDWFGHRPCLPRMLPFAGRAPRHAGLWWHFGHGHQGFTLGPTTAAILAQVMDGREDVLSRALTPTA